MVSRSVRGLLLAGIVAAVVLAGTTDAPAQGLFDRLFGGWGWWGTPYTTYRSPWCDPCGPTACPTSCSTCPTSCPTGVTAYSPTCDPCSAQTSYYTPVTKRRWRIVREPVTTYRPAYTQDPCTGCMVTSYQPVTHYRWRLRLVPYTTYRPAYSSPFSTVSYYGGSYSCNPCGSFGCDPCAGGACSGGVCGPASYSGGASCAAGDCGGTQTYNGGSGAIDLSSPPAKTFQENGQPQQQRSLKVVPESEEAEQPEPRLIGPESNTTTRPLLQAAQVRLVSLPPSAAPARPVPLEYNGWRPASD